METIGRDPTLPSHTRTRAGGEAHDDLSHPAATTRIPDRCFATRFTSMICEVKDLNEETSFTQAAYMHAIVHTTG